MGNHLHQIVKCHTCPRRKALGGPKSNGKWASAEKSGWVSLFGWSNRDQGFQRHAQGKRVDMALSDVCSQACQNQGAKLKGPVFVGSWAIWLNAGRIYCGG